MSRRHLSLFSSRGHRLTGRGSSAPQFRFAHQVAVEPLESRHLLAASPVIISEVEASNKNGIADAAGANADWLEITNTSSSQTVNMSGWQLQYKSVYWAFPNMNLGPGEARVIFCDSTSQTDPVQELHTNFNLSKSGAKLYLLDPTSTVVSSYAPYPAMGTDVSYGQGETVTETDVVAAGATATYMAPTSGALGLSWAQPGFNDSGWSSGQTGLGFDQATGFHVTTYVSSLGSVPNLATAQQVVSTPSYQASTYAATTSVVNFAGVGAGGHYTSTVDGFPGLKLGTETDNVVVEADGTITIPAAGNYTFGVNSDDGFSMSIAGATFSNGVNATYAAGSTMAYDALRGPGDTLATATFPAAGTYNLSLTFYQNGGGSSLELFEAAGSKTSYDASFQLVGDTADGGLPVFSNPIPGVSGTGSPIAAAVATNVQPTVAAAIAAAGATSLYTRIDFDAANLSSLSNLTLKMQYDDAYVAYINGVEVASSNVTETVTGITANGTTATASDTNHRYSVGDTVTISGASPAAYDGTFTVTAVTANTFSYTMASAPSGAAGGTITASDTTDWNAPAAEARLGEVQPTTYENVDVSQFLNAATVGHLNATGNVLAIQVLMASPNQTHLLVLPELSYTTIAQDGLTYLAEPSPGGYNLVGTWQTPLTISAQRGFYYAPFQVSLSTSTVGGAIYYTTDGSVPSATNGTKYTGPIQIAGTTTLRALTVGGGQADSPVQTETYIFPNQVLSQSSTPSGFPTDWGLDTSGNVQATNYGMNQGIIATQTNAAWVQDLLSLPTVSITTAIPNLFDASTTPNPTATDNTGIYTNVNNELKNLSMEVPASFEYFNSDGSINVQSNIGLQLEGNVGRYPQFQLHGFQLQFKPSYGSPSLSFPLYPGDPVTTFTNLDLKAGFNDAFSWDGSNAQYLRDQFMAQTQLAMGDAAFHTDYVMVYLDGLFWGLYSIDERPDSNFSASYYGGDPSSWEANNSGNAVSGSDPSLPMWNALQSFGNSNNMSTLAAYEQIQGNNPDGTRNPAYTDLLDMKNYIDYMLLNIWGGNADWPYHNFYAADETTSDSTGFKFYSWDAEWTLGDTDSLSTDETGANSGVAQVYGQFKNNPEFQSLFADEARKFLFDGGPLTSSVAVARYQSMENNISLAMHLESARWGTIPTSPGPVPDTFAAWQSEASYVTGTFLAQRTDIVIAQLQAAGLYPNVAATEYLVNGINEYGGSINPGDQLTISGTGPIYYTLDGTDPRLIGGALSPSAILYTGPITLTQSVEVESRTLTGGVWSALSDATFSVNLGSAIRVTEMMFDPAAPSSQEAAAGYTAQDFQYLEIQNVSSQALPLQGLQFTSGITFTFPSVSIAPNQYLLVVSNKAAFQMRYPGVNASLIAGQFTGHLSTNGEQVQMTGPDGTSLEDYTYSGAWYPQTDGGGFSLQVVNPSATNAVLSTASGWEPSGTPGGTPGTGESNAIPLPGSVVINEVLANPTTAGGDLIELANTTGQAINIGGWWLSDSSSNLLMYQLAAGTTIAANGYLVLSDAKNYGPGSGDPGAKTPFALSKYGFGVYLASNAAGAAGGYRDTEVFGATPAGVSVGRYTTSAGVTDFVLLAAPTFGSGPNYAGAANSSATYVPPIDINEVMYDPSAPTAAEQAAGYSSADFQYIELTNRSSATQTLSNFYLSGGVGFSFGWNPDGTSNESETLESGATATWQVAGLTAGQYTVYADFSLTDPLGNTRTADTSAGYSITFPGGTLNVASIDQNTAVAGKLALGTITVTASGTAQVVLTRGLTSGNDWTLASQVEFVKSSQDLKVGSPAFASRSISSGLTTLAPNASVVIVSNAAAFNERYNAVANHLPVAGVFSGQLSALSDSLQLFQAGPADAGTGFLPFYDVDSVSFSDAAPWPTEPGSGNGSPLVRVHTADFGSEPLSWKAGNAGGTPGAANLPLVNFTPSVPTNLAGGVSLNPNQVQLTWAASTAPQTNVDHYVIYRDGVAIGTSLTTAYTDATAQSGSTYEYAVLAVSRDGYSSALSVPIGLGLPGVAAYSWPSSQQMSIEFNEPLSPSAANIISNYALTGGISVTGVTLSRDNTEVTLSTNTPFNTGTAYTLTLNSLTTASGHPLPASIPLTFTYGTTVGQFMDSVTPPVPANLQGTVISGSAVRLNWQAAVDVTSGIDHYAIYRDGTLYSTASSPTFLDSAGISAQTPHTYQVAVVNWDGLQGALSAPLRIGPTGIAAVTVLGPTVVAVRFTEPVTSASAQNVANYQIPGANVSSAVLQADGATVLLTTSNLASNSFTLTASNIITRDGASLNNVSAMSSGTTTGWTVNFYQSTFGTLGSLADAATVINTPADQASTATLTPGVINYGTGGASGNFQPDNLLPTQNTVNDNIFNYVLVGSGDIYVPAAGQYTFDCDSDDGFALTITGASFVTGTNLTGDGAGQMEYDGGRGATDSLGVFSFPTSGYYPISLTFFQGGGPSGCELSAAPGAYASFTPGAFQLVGDTADGGLSMGGTYQAPPFSLGVNALDTNSGSPAISGTSSDPSLGLTARVNGTYYAIANQNGAWSLPASDIGPLPAGSYDVNLSGWNIGNLTNFDPTTSELTVDTTAPTVSITNPGQQSGPVSSLQIHFSKPITGFDLSDLQFSLGGSSTPLGQATLTSTNGQDWTLGNLTQVTAATGTYGLSLAAVGSGITDLAGNPLAADASMSFPVGASQPTADLAIVASDNRGGSSVTNAQGSVNPGGTVVYTIVVANSGPSAAAGATVADTLPAGIASDTFTATATGGATGFTASGAGKLSDTVTMPVGSTITYVITATVASTATGTLSNTATITAPGTVTDPTTANNTATDSDNVIVPTVSLAVATQSVSETAGTFTVTVNLSSASTAPVTVPFSLSGTAASGVNYSGVSASPLVIPAGQTTATITGTLINTGPNSGTTLIVTLGTPVNAALGATTVDTLTIQTPLLAITETDSAGGSSVTHATGAAVAGTQLIYTITVSNTGPVSVSGVQISDPLPTALTGATYTTSLAGGATDNQPSGAGNVVDTVTLPSGSSVTYTVTATISAGTTGSLTNTATVTPTIGSPLSAAVTDTISAPATVSITPGTLKESAFDRADSFVFTVSLSAPTTVPLSVQVDTQNGTAKAPADYGAVQGLMLTFQPGGATSQTVTVTPTMVTTVSADKTFSVVLSHVSGGTLGSSVATGTIEEHSRWENDTLPEDVNNSATVTAIDALIIINYLNSTGAGALPIDKPAGTPPFYLDENGDGLVTAIDSLRVINYINAHTGDTDDAQTATPAAVPVGATNTSAAVDQAVAGMALAAMNSGTTGNSTASRFAGLFADATLSLDELSTGAANLVSPAVASASTPVATSGGLHTGQAEDSDEAAPATLASDMALAWEAEWL